MNKPSSLPHLALFFNAGLWGLSWVPYKWMEAHGLSILWATAFAYCMATLGLALARPALLGRLLRPQSIWWMGLFYGLTNSCFNWALALGDVVRVVLLFYLMPLWAAVFARLLLGERLSAEGVARLVLALLGAAVVVGWPLVNSLLNTVPGDLSNAQASALPSGHSGSLLLADLLALLGGLFFGLANVFLRKWEAATQGERTMTMFLGSGLVPLALLGLLGLVSVAIPASLHAGLEGLVGASLASPLTADPAVLWVLPLLALGLAAANFSLQYGGSRLPTQVTSLIMLSEVVFAAVSAAILLDKVLQLSEWVGGSMIIGAAVWASLRPPRKTPNQTA